DVAPAGFEARGAGRQVEGRGVGHDARGVGAVQHDLVGGVGGDGVDGRVVAAVVEGEVHRRCFAGLALPGDGGGHVDGAGRGDGRHLAGGDAVEVELPVGLADAE